MEQPSLFQTAGNYRSRRTASTTAGEVCYVPLPCSYFMSESKVVSQLVVFLK